MIACASSAARAAGLAEQREHAGDVLDVLRAGLLGGRAGPEVVVALGQAQAALVEHGDLVARVLEVLLLAEAEERVHADQLLVRQELGQVGLGR